MKPIEVLEKCLLNANLHLSEPFTSNFSVQEKVAFVCRCNTNKAPIRFLLACLLAKIDRPEVDIRKPYTEISGTDSFSGRTYDEVFIEGFVAKHALPCNATTAFLTPAFRNIDRLLTPQLVLIGKPKEVYAFTLDLLDIVHTGKETPINLLTELLRNLLIIKAENDNRMDQLLAALKQSSDSLALSSEQIATLLHQHLNCKNSSRLPVLIVTAAYSTVKNLMGEKPLSLQSHNAADKQTGAMGDVEISLANDEKVVSCYEMKDKRVTQNDIHQALKKIANQPDKIDNFIFITTEPIEPEVADFAKTIYDQTGVEFAILDCFGFARHFLHFFHRHRMAFLENYQKLVLEEPSSSVGQSLKEAFLILRKQAEGN